MWTGFLLFSRRVLAPSFHNVVMKAYVISLTRQSWALPNARAPGGTRTLTLSDWVLNPARTTEFRHRGIFCNQYQNCREAADPLHTHTIMDPGWGSVYLYRESRRCTIPSTNRYFFGLFCASRGELNPNLLLGALTVSYRSTSESHGMRFLQEPVTLFPPVRSGTYLRILIPKRLIPNYLYRPIGNALSHVKTRGLGFSVL